VVEERDGLQERVNELEEVAGRNEQLAERVEELERLDELLNSVDPWPTEIHGAIRKGWDSRHKSRYRKGVKVLLVRWESDDLGVSQEISDLERVFSQYYHYEVSQCSIPDQQPFTFLCDRVKRFIGKHDPETLLIFYYAGHGSIDPVRNNTIWAG